MKMITIVIEEDDAQVMVVGCELVDGLTALAALCNVIRKDTHKSEGWIDKKIKTVTSRSFAEKLLRKSDVRTGN